MDDGNLRSHFAQSQRCLLRALLAPLGVALEEVHGRGIDDRFGFIEVRRDDINTDGKTIGKEMRGRVHE